ncbi:MAG: prolipoprotein diacylglyceryl transferase [Candidatus Hydrogenedentes bacterium]|nr:prolipoprotein diacylglyceryl transferase [Candidatus Hydrogenedentota bacterium]
MRPDLIHIGGYTVHAYAAAIVLAFVVCSLMGLRDAARYRGLYGSPLFCVIVLLAALMGARFAALWQMGAYREFWRALILWDSGMVFYGGLVGGVLAGLIYVLIRKFPPLQVADVAAPYMALGEMFGRIGCFLNGCCWGKVSALPWAMGFPRASYPFRHQVQEHMLVVDADASLPVHPTQLYMAAGLLLMFFLLRHLMKKRIAAGGVILLYVFLHGCLRFTVEFFRADNAHTYGPFTTSQVFSLALLLGAAAGLGAWWWNKDRTGLTAQADTHAN